MSLFKKNILILLAFAVTPAYANLTPEQFRRFVASEYAKAFADEFNLYKKNELLKQAYDLFYPPQFHKKLTKWNDKTSVKADGPILIIEHEGHAPVRLEIVDLYQQQYKIDGKRYAHAWNGNPEVEVEALRRRIAPKGASISNLFLPESEANPAVPVAILAGEGVVAAEVAADVAAVVMAEASIEVAARGGSAASLAGTTGSASLVAETEAGAEAGLEHTVKVLKTLVEDPKVKEKLIESAAQRQHEFDMEMMKALQKTTDLLAKVVETMSEGAKLAKPNRLLAYLQFIRGSAFSIMSLSVPFAVTHTNPLTLLQCIWYSVKTFSKQCQTVIKAMAAGDSSPANPPQPGTCNTKSGVDLSGYYDKSEGRKNVFSIHFGSAGTDGRASPVSAIGFTLSEGKVEPGSIRQYDVKFDPNAPGDKAFYVTSVRQVTTEDDRELTAQKMVLAPNLRLSNEANIEEELKQQKTRDDIIASAKVSSEKILSPELLEEFQNDKDKINHEKNLARANEMSKIASLILLYGTLSGGCDANAHSDPKTVSAAAMGDTGILPLEKDKNKTQQ